MARTLNPKHSVVELIIRTYTKITVFRSSISNVEKFNKARNEIVHKMRRANEAELISIMRKGKKNFDNIYELYNGIQDDFRVIFHSYQKDAFIDYFEEDDFSETN